MKINQVFPAWPPGTVATTAFLQAQGVSPKLARQYCASGWLEDVGHGAYIRHGERAGWPGAVYALQNHLGRDVHPGGRTALQLHGLAHDLPLAARPVVDLYGPPGLRLPVWLREHDWQATLQYTGTGLFTQASATVQHPFGNFSLAVSTPEQAILEVLDGVPERDAFESAQALMEGLSTLRSKLMQSLLESCTSVKVKRLCLYLGDHLELPWRKRLDDSRVDLGTGKRQIVPGGKLDARYGITVPKDTQRQIREDRDHA